MGRIRSLEWRLWSHLDICRKSDVLWLKLRTCSDKQSQCFTAMSLQLHDRMRCRGKACSGDTGPCLWFTNIRHCCHVQVYCTSETWNVNVSLLKKKRFLMSGNLKNVCFCYVWYERAHIIYLSHVQGSNSNSAFGFPHVFWGCLQQVAVNTHYFTEAISERRLLSDMPKKIQMKKLS